MSVSEPNRNIDAEKRSITGEVTGVVTGEVQGLLTEMVGERWRTRDL